MNQKLLRHQVHPLLFISLLFLGLSSCVSYDEVVGYEDDGIYGRSYSDQQVQVKGAEALQAEDFQSDLYGDYFGQKAQQYNDILDSEIFTDPDSYSSEQLRDSTQVVQDSTYFSDELYQGYGYWGDNQNQVVINVYDNWGNHGFGWGWNSYWGIGPRWGWGWNNWGWGAGWVDPGFALGWNSWGWNRWGWNAGWGGGWGWNGWGWNSPFPYNNRYAWGRNGGRRGYGATGLASINSLRGRSNLTTASGRTSARSSATTRSSRMSAYARNQQYRSNRTSRATGRSYGSGRTNSYGRTGSATRRSGYGSSSTRRSNGSSVFRRSGSSTGSRTSSGSRSSRTSRSSGVSRSSSGSRSSGYRSSGGSSRSSSSTRSSGGSRSSGGTRSSGGRSSSGRSNGRSN